MRLTQLHMCVCLNHGHGLQGVFRWRLSDRQDRPPRGWMNRDLRLLAEWAYDPITASRRHLPSELLANRSPAKAVPSRTPVVTDLPGYCPGVS